MKIKDELNKYIDSGFPIIYINSFEENKTDVLIQEAMRGRMGMEWNASRGFCDFQTKSILLEDRSLADTLKSLCVNGELERRYLVLRDAHLFFDDPEVIACLKDIARQISSGFDATIVIVSPVLRLPKELEKFITILEMEYPDQEEIRSQIHSFADEMALTVPESLMEEMSMAFKGLTAFEIDNLLALALAEDGQLAHSDLKLIIEQKRQMIKKCGILEMIELREHPEDIGGLYILKQWLKRKAGVFQKINKALQYGVDIPKGVLIAGMPGCGKSLCAKVTAQMFGVPLLRLDMGKIMGKYVGESEENMRHAIALAEAISPCVLWIDELEKAFAGVNGSGNEVTVRLFGTFLTWMQEKTSPTFVVSTANDVTVLPPELMRKGRFDEIFYVELPNAEERKNIFEIHIRKRRHQDLPHIDLDKLLPLTEGFSGADVEGVVIEAVESAFVDGSPSLTTQHLCNAIRNTHSLSEIMRDSLAALSKEYENRHFKRASN